MQFLNPISPLDQANDDPSRMDLDDDERLGQAIVQGLVYFAYFLAAMLICGLCFSSCTTPRAVEEHHHHHYEADTAAVHAQVDRHLVSWHEEMTQFFQQKLEQYTSQQQQTEHQQETITETVTVSLDSLGREIRTEQRTISRDITRELQQQEQRLTQEYEARLRVAVDSLNDAYQQRYDSLASHVARMDSTFVKKTPVGDTRPWYQKLWDNFRTAFVCLLIAAVVWTTRGWWLKLIHGHT